MAEYIDREAARKAVENLCTNENENWIGNDNCSFIDPHDAIDKIMDIPAADVEPVAQGKPIIRRRNFGGFREYTGKDRFGEMHTITVDERYECNAKYCFACKSLLCSRFENYCPNCGAKQYVEV